MSRAVASRSRSRDRNRDDIPVARRSRSAVPKRRGGFGLLLACGLVFSASLVTVLLVPEWLKGSRPPAQVEGIDARPSGDGRLLGHFPYSEAGPDVLVPVGAGIELHRDAALSLDAMRRSAAADGVDLRLLSGYRSHDLQKRIFFDVKSQRNQSAAERAKVSAPPGYSEHSTGYAVDLGDGEDPATNLSQSFENTRAFRWLQDHAASYHFTLSFPVVNPQGVSYEPWHWRFEGSSEALRAFEPARRLADGR